MTRPNFIIIGAARSGTTALHRHLSQHPQIYMSPVKEPRFFAFESEADLQFSGPGDLELHRSTIVSLENYEALFDDVADEPAIGEASPVYLCSPKAAMRMKSLVPEARLIAILRHPVERAYSHFMLLVRQGAETLTDFSEALQVEAQRAHDNWEYRWRYKELGFYSVQLKRYFDAFDRSRIKICLYEEFDADPQRVLREIYRFLVVDETFVADTSVRYNISGVPRSKVLHAALSKLQKSTQATFDPAPRNDSDETTIVRRLGQSSLLEAARRAGIGLINSNLAKPPLAPDVRKQLLAEYKEDILTLQYLIQRDLSRWLM